MKSNRYFLGILILIAVCSCDQGNIVQIEENPYEPMVLTNEQQTIVQAGNQFAFNYLAEVEKRHESSSFIASPLSAELLLGMMLNGAEGELAAEIKNALGFEEQETGAVNYLYGELIRLLPNMDKLTTVASARALFPCPSLQLFDGFKTTANSVYLAETEVIDFSKRQTATEKLNNWCSRNTNGLIQDMFSVSEIDPSIALVLTDANYFNGAWSEFFDKNETRKEIFTKEDGTTVSVPFMKRTAIYSINPAAANEVSIPYGNGAYSMVVILPNEGQTTRDAIKSRVEGRWSLPSFPMEVELWLPRFEITSQIDLLSVLCSTGIPSLANRGAFTRLACGLENADLTMKQKTAIRVDEKGTEAAAVSEATFRYTGVGQSKIVFHADKPFIFLICENSTGAILYAGCFRGESIR